MHRKSSNIIEGLLFVWKEELFTENSDEKRIPFVLTSGIDAFEHRNKKTNLFYFTFIIIESIWKMFIRDYTVDTKEIEKFLVDQKHYFLIQGDQVSIFKNNELLSTISSKAISMKPILYDSLIYLYSITCPNLMLEECYVLIEDSLILKNAFTFLGKTHFDEFEENK